MSHRSPSWTNHRDPTWVGEGACNIHFWVPSSRFYLRRLERSLGISFFFFFSKIASSTILWAVNILWSITEPCIACVWVCVDKSVSTLKTKEWYSDNETLHMPHVPHVPCKLLAIHMGTTTVATRTQSRSMCWWGCFWEAMSLSWPIFPPKVRHFLSPLQVIT